MKFDYNSRVRIALIFMVGFALYSNLQLLFRALEFDRNLIGKDEISLYQNRFDGVKKMLPQYGVVGYVGGALKNEDGSPNELGLRNWYLAQYTLAPLVLSTGTGQSVYLVNRNADGTEPVEADQAKTRDLGSGNKILDFGNGVQLLRSESQ